MHGGGEVGQRSVESAMRAGTRRGRAGGRRTMPVACGALAATLLAMMLALALPPHGSADAAPVAANEGRPVTGPRAGWLMTPSVRLAEAVSRDYMLGSWRAETLEFGHDIEIVWSLSGDGRLVYDLVRVDGVERQGSTGTWMLEDDVVTEHWVRPDGSTGVGRGRIEKIDEQSFWLTILDNGSPEYTGIRRLYRRIGPPQLSLGVSPR